PQEGANNFAPSAMIRGSFSLSLACSTEDAEAVLSNRLSPGRAKPIATGSRTAMTRTRSEIPALDASAFVGCCSVTYDFLRATQTQTQPNRQASPTPQARSPACRSQIVNPI